MKALVTDKQRGTDQSVVSPAANINAKRPSNLRSQYLATTHANTPTITTIPAVPDEPVRHSNLVATSGHQHHKGASILSAPNGRIITIHGKSDSSLSRPERSKSLRRNPAQKGQNRQVCPEPRILGVLLGDTTQGSCQVGPQRSGELDESLSDFRRWRSMHQQTHDQDDWDSIMANLRVGEKSRYLYSVSEHTTAEDGEGYYGPTQGTRLEDCYLSLSYEGGQVW